MNPVALFGEVRQLGYVVPAGRLQAHLDHWVHTLGVGPWLLLEHPLVEDFVHLGEPGSIDVTLAIAQMGSLQVELVVQHDRQPSTFLEFLERTAGQGGLHHLAHWPRDLDLAERQAEELGWELWTAGRIGAHGRFRHFLTEDHPGTVIELAEVTGRRLAYFEDELTERGRRFDPTVDPPVLRLSGQA